MLKHLTPAALLLILSACGSSGSSNDQQASPLRVELLDGVGYVVPGQAAVDPTLARTLPGIARVGMVADGVSRLLVRVFTNEAGTVAFRYPPARNVSDRGEISIPGRADLVMPTVVEPVSGQEMAFCVYRAPTNFVQRVQRAQDEPRVERSLLLEIEFTPASGAAPFVTQHEVRLRRPPLVLSHGLWSSPETWQEEFLPLAENRLPRFLVHALDYRLTTHLKFADNMVLVASGIQSALQLARDQGFAASQVDWVGHSLGGVLPRFYYRVGVDKIDGFEWARSDNFGAGDIHKLIVLNSPQWGSTWGNLIETYRNASPVIQYLAQFLVPIGGAIQGMQVGSPEMAQIGATGIPAHAVASVGAENLLQGTTELIDVVGLLPAAYAESYGRILQAIDLVAKPKTSELYFGLKHDLAVHEASQLAGLDPNFRTAFDGFSYNHLMVTSDPDYFRRVVDLVNAAMDDFQTLPAPDLSAPFRAAGPVLRSIIEGEIAFTAPLPGPRVTPNQRLSLALRAPEGFLPHQGVLFTPGGAVPVTWRGLEGTATVTVPVDAVGTFPLLAVAVDERGRVASSKPLEWTVDVPSPVTGLRCGVPHLRFSSLSQKAGIPVRIKHADGIERPGHLAVAGTVYRSEDPGVAQVSASGEVRSVGEGRTRVWVENGGFSISIDVNVNPTPY